MAYQIFKLPKAVALDTSANVFPGAKLNFFLTNSSTPTDTYTTSALGPTHQNPVVADSAGVFPAIYLDPEITYKVTYTTSADELIYTIDPVNDQTLSQGIIGGLLYPQTAAELAAGVTPTDYSKEPGDELRYGASPVGSAAANTTAFNQGLSANKSVWNDFAGTYAVNDNLNVQSSQTLNLPQGVTIQPSAWTDTGVVDTGIVDINSRADVHVTGGILDGNKATLPSGRIFGVRVQDSADVTLSFQKIINCPGSTSDGVLAGDGLYVAGESLRFKGIGLTCAGNVRNGAAIVQCDGWQIIGGFFDGTTGTNPGAGIDVESDSPSNPIYDGAIIGAGLRSNYRALQITVGTSGLEVIGNSMRNSDAGDVIIANCDTVGLIGNHLRSTPTVASSAIIHEIVNAERVRIIGNDLYGSSDSNETYGIYVSDNVKWLIISGNIISGTESFAVRLGNDSMDDDIYGVIITNNIFLNCGDPAANVPVIFIGANSGGTVYPRYVKVRNNLCVDERAGGDAATAFLQISSLVPNATIAEYDIGDNLIVGTQSRYLNCPNEGGYTATLTGVDAVVTGTVAYSRNDEGSVTLAIPAITGTSNTTAATLTGMPEYLRPNSTQTVLMVTQDNGTEKFSRATIASNGVITLQNALSATFAGSGTKGAGASTVTYRRV